MYFSPLFAIEKLKPIDPGITAFFAWVMGGLFVILLGMGSVYLVQLLRTRSKTKEIEKLKAEQDIWFDAHKSILHKGPRETPIPESSLEYYVCKLIFKDPQVYRDDLDILLAAGEEDKNDRAVYFAVDRINNKARRAFKLEDKLLKRNKERTRLNDNYF